MLMTPRIEIEAIRAYTSAPLLPLDLEAITRYQNGSESVEEIAKSIHANESVVRNWIKQFE